MSLHLGHLAGEALRLRDVVGVEAREKCAPREAEADVEVGVPPAVRVPLLLRPKFFALSTTTMRSSRREAMICAVPSVEPSLTIASSKSVYDCVRMLSIASARCRSPLYTGITIVTRGEAL